MKKYNNIIITNNYGQVVFDGSYMKLLNKFNNNKEKCDEYIEECKEKGYEYNTRTCYYDFEYDNTGTSLSKIWFEDICDTICFENTRELVESIIIKSFKCINNARCEYIGNKYLLIVLPKKYDSLIVYRPSDYDYKFFAKLLKEIYININEKHNRTLYPKIRVSEFVNNWRIKTKYADYNEGYTFYYNSIPKENILDILLK